MQTSLAEADQYSYIAHCKNVEPWWALSLGFTLIDYPFPPPPTPHPPPPLPPKRVLIITCTTIWVCYPIIVVCFAHLLILEYPDNYQNLINSLLYYPGPRPKIASQSFYDLLSNVVHRQTNRQTNATKNITSFAKEVNIWSCFIICMMF